MHMHVLIERRHEFAFPLLIANGVTSIRDMGGAMTHQELTQMRAEIAAGTMIGPRIVAAPGKIMDGPYAGQRDAFMKISTPEEARRAVADSKAAGWSFVKPYNLLSRESYLALVDEAHRRSIDIEGHVPFALTAAEVSDAGQRTIEHAADLIVSVSSEETAMRARMATEASSSANLNWARAAIEIDAAGSYDEVKAAALFARFARNHTWQCPTLVLKHRTGAATEDALLQDPRLQYIPHQLRERWSDIFRTLALPTGSPAGRKLRAERTEQIVGALHRAGVKILAGTDSPPQPYMFPGFSLHDELALMAGAGMTPLQALQTATSNAAEFERMSRVAGSIAPGKNADLVLLAANPLDDIRNTQKIEAVVLAGRYMPRASLDRLLAQAAGVAAKR
jgi:imidazolonepropionase-like amidohydrolase